MKLIYIAGPYRGDVEANILAATRMGQILKRGQKVFPIVPHVNGDGPDDYMLAGTMALMRRCDAVLALPTWQSSQGAVAEIRDADARGLPVFYSVDELYRWVDGKKVGTYNGQRGDLPTLLSGLPQTLVLRHAGRSQEVRHWRKEADDGLLYEAHTIEKVKLVSDTGAVFEEGGGTVGGVVPTLSSPAGGGEVAGPLPDLYGPQAASIDEGVRFMVRLFHPDGRQTRESLTMRSRVLYAPDGQVLKRLDVILSALGLLHDAKQEADGSFKVRCPWCKNPIQCVVKMTDGKVSAHCFMCSEGGDFFRMASAVGIQFPDAMKMAAKLLSAQHMPNTRPTFIAWCAQKKIPVNYDKVACPFCKDGTVQLEPISWSCASCKRAGTYPELAQQGT